MHPEILICHVLLATAWFFITTIPVFLSILLPRVPRLPFTPITFEWITSPRHGRDNISSKVEDVFYLFIWLFFCINFEPSCFGRTIIECQKWKEATIFGLKFWDLQFYIDTSCKVSNGFWDGSKRNRSFKKCLAGTASFQTDLGLSHKSLELFCYSPQSMISIYRVQMQDILFLITLRTEKGQAGVPRLFWITAVFSLPGFLF